jgi:hypothetical protein
MLSRSNKEENSSKIGFMCWDESQPDGIAFKDDSDHLRCTYPNCECPCHPK